MNVSDFLTDDQIRRAISDFEIIDRAGLKQDLADVISFVRREYRERLHGQSIGDGIQREMLAGDLASILGIDRERCRRIARKNLAWPQTAVRTIAHFAADIRRGVVR